MTYETEQTWATDHETGRQMAVWTVRHPDGRAGVAVDVTREDAIRLIARQFDAQDQRRVDV